MKRSSHSATVRKTIISLSVAAGMVVLGGVGSVAVSTPAYAACGCLPVQSAVWQMAQQEIYASQKAVMSKGFIDLNFQWRNLMQSMTSSLKIVTKQVELASEKRSNSNEKLMETLAQVDRDLAVSKGTYQTLRDYGPLGQGHDPCEQLKRQRDINESIGNANDEVKAIQHQAVAAAPGKYANPAATTSAWATARSEVYCRPELAAKGYCTARPGSEGRDTNPSVIFDQYGSADNAAAIQYINYFAGVPNATPPKDIAKTADAMAYMEAKRQRDALASPALHSVATIKAWSSPDGPMKQLDTRVGQFIGGDGYKQFKVYVHSGEPRGLLVQYAKMAALELQMRYMQYEQLQRMETSLAAMSSSEASDMQDAADKAGRQLAQQAVAAKVK